MENKEVNDLVMTAAFRIVSRRARYAWKINLDLLEEAGQDLEQDVSEIIDSLHVAQRQGKTDSELEQLARTLSLAVGKKVADRYSRLARAEYFNN